MKIGRLAPYYRWIEYCVFGRALERLRFAFLDRVAGARRILILGEGDGRVLSMLLILAPQAQFEVVEVSPEMIALARRRTGNSERIRFLCHDARTVEWPPGAYDAVLTMFFLDCFTEVDARRLIQRIAGALKPQALWLVSEFAIPGRAWRRWHAQIWIGAMYLFFGAVTGLRVRSLPPVQKLISEAGMRSVERKETRAGLMISAVYESVRVHPKHGW
jgi:SAM-dependent methyltransferase